MMNIKIGFCRIITQSGICYGEITEIFDDFVLFLDYTPPAVEIALNKKDILQYEQVEESDIPQYE